MNNKITVPFINAGLFHILRVTMRIEKLHYPNSKKHLNFWLLCLTLVPVYASAWSKTGHHIIAQIARHYMSKPAQDSVQKYLGTMTFESASTWMDDVKYKKGYPNMRNWHYVNVEKDKTYVATDSPNIINKLQLTIHNLKTNRVDRATVHFNIKVLFHLLGDLHQPLHTGYESDRGGNEAQVKYFELSTNLHHVWDNLIIKSEKISTASCLKHNKIINHLSKKFKSADILFWVEESRLLLNDVYAVNNDSITSTYVNRSVPIIEIQLLKAGYRLALILENIFVS